MIAAAVNAAIARQLETVFAGPLTPRRPSSPQAASRLELETLTLLPRPLLGAPVEAVLSGGVAALSIETRLPWNPLALDWARVRLVARGAALVLRVRAVRPDPARPAAPHAIPDLDIEELLRVAGAAAWSDLVPALVERALSHASLSLEKLSLLIELTGLETDCQALLSVEALTVRASPQKPGELSIGISGLVVEWTCADDAASAQFPVLLQPMSLELALTLSQRVREASEPSHGRLRPPLVLSLSASADKLDLTPSATQLQQVLRATSLLAEVLRESQVVGERWAMARLLYSRGRRFGGMAAEGSGISWKSRMRRMLLALRMLVRPVEVGLVERLFCQQFSKALEAQLLPEVQPVDAIAWSQVLQDFKGILTRVGPPPPKKTKCE